SGWRLLPATAHPTSRRASRSRSATSTPSVRVSWSRVDCLFVGRLHGTRGTVWQLTAIDVCSSFAWAELVVCPNGQPSPKQTSRLVCRVARELRAAGWRLERVLTDNGMEFRAERFRRAIAVHGVRITGIRAGRPQSNGHVEALHKTILDGAGDPPSP